MSVHRPTFNTLMFLLNWDITIKVLSVIWGLPDKFKTSKFTNFLKNKVMLFSVTLVQNDRSTISRFLWWKENASRAPLVIQAHLASIREVSCVFLAVITGWRHFAVKFRQCPRLRTLSRGLCFKIGSKRLSVTDNVLHMLMTCNCLQRSKTWNDGFYVRYTYRYLLSVWYLP